MGLANSLIQDTVANLDFHKPIFVLPSTPVCEVIETLRQSGRGCVLVAESTRLLGIFSERDLLLRIFGDKKAVDTPIHTVMTTNPTCIHRSDSIADVIKIMRGGGHRHLPILDEKQVAFGVLSIKHIVQYLVDHFPETVYNLPPDPDHAPPTREGA